MKKKKKGSSLIMVLAMAAIFTMISGIVATAVVGTTKANNAEKHWEDMLYTCEAGVERALVKGRSGGFSSLVNYGENTTIAIPSTEFPNLNISVSVKVTKSGDLKFPSLPHDSLTNPVISSYYLVESTSTYAGRSSRTLKAKFKEGLGNGSLFRYTICGESVTINGGGTITSSYGDINSSLNKPIVNIPTSNINSMTQYGFNLPKFTFEKIKEIDLVGGAITPSVSDDSLNKTLDRYNNKGIMKKSFIGKGNKTFEVYLINTPYVKIKPEVIQDGVKKSKPLKNAMIISSGEVEVISDTTMNIEYGSIVAKGVKLTGAGAIHIQYAPYTDESNPYHPSYPLTDQNVREINNWIKTFDPNWESSGGGGSSPTITPGDYE